MERLSSEARRESRKARTGARREEAHVLENSNADHGLVGYTPRASDVFLKKEESAMSQNSDILPAPVGGKKPPLIPTLVVGGAFFAGLVVTAVRNWAQLGLIVSHFGALWSVEENRYIITALLFRMLLTAVVF